jgi:fused signal recognition particle receptor
VFNRFRGALFRRGGQEEQPREEEQRQEPEQAGENAPGQVGVTARGAEAVDHEESVGETTLVGVAPAPAEAPVEDYGPDYFTFDEDDVVDVAEAQLRRPARFNPFRSGLVRTRRVFGHITDVFREPEIAESLWDELEETLIGADVGIVTTEWLIETLRGRAETERMRTPRQVQEALQEELRKLLGEPGALHLAETGTMTVILVVGVNGVGKTTTIAKLAYYLRRRGHRVLLAAGDTFRAAAIDQLKLWGERIKVPVVSHQPGADPGAVVFDALNSGEARGSDVVIVDTAGRLHTKYNLMEELKKINRVIARKDAGAPQETLLVLDATTGQNAVLQAQQFGADIGVTGLVLTKLDGTAKGGVVFAIADELEIPLKFIGTGERIGDFAPFDPEAFVGALFTEED